MSSLAPHPMSDSMPNIPSVPAFLWPSGPLGEPVHVCVMASETDERGQLLLTGGPRESPDPLPLLSPPSWQLLCLWEILGLGEAQLETTPLHSITPPTLPAYLLSKAWQCDWSLDSLSAEL